MAAAIPIFLFTDFGSADLYVGQVKAVLHAHAPESAVFDLLNDAPSFDVEGAAHLLAALAPRLPAPSVTLAVVDPGVGSSSGAAAVEADGRWFVWPDNGLLSVHAARSQSVRRHALSWLPEPASASFHGRDLFAPAAAAIAREAVEWSGVRELAQLDVRLGDGDLERIVYIDHYGNAMTGIRAACVDPDACVHVQGTTARRARVFSDVQPGEVFCYENSLGLLENAANRASAAEVLGLRTGEPVALEVPR